MSSVSTDTSVIQGVSNEEDRVQGLDRGLNLAGEELEGGSIRCTVNGCSKVFASRWSLTRHVRSHTGERPFHCGTCGKSFIQKCSLTRHEQIHLSSKVWVCPYLLCAKKFKLKEYLDIHKRTHDNVTASSSDDTRMNDINIDVKKSDRVSDQLRERLIRMSIKHRRDMDDQRAKERNIRNISCQYEKTARDAFAILAQLAPQTITGQMKETMLLPGMTDLDMCDGESQMAVASTLTAMSHGAVPENSV